MAVNAPVRDEASPAIDAGERLYVASQWQLMWWRFRKHRLAMAAGAVVALFYLVAAGADFLATTDPNLSDARRSLMPPQRVYWFDGWLFRPHVYAVTGKRDLRTFKRVYTADPDDKIPVRFLARGYTYNFLGLFPTDRHLLGVGEGHEAAQTLFFLGTDVQGRDLWSRLLVATRVSMSIGLVGVALSLFLGILLGGLSGYYGGFVDGLIQRIIELLRSVPTIPLWMGLAAAIPPAWSMQKRYFGITVIISLVAWTSLARVVRGKFLELREADFVVAAKLAGRRDVSTIFLHMVPSFLSHIIAATTLALPAMIISETSLSFLGLGLRPPAVSWGVLLQQAQNVQTVAISPWLMLPAIPVIIAVLAFNFLGDGLRDAADPYGQ